MQKKTEGRKDPYQSITVKLRRDTALTVNLEALCGEQGVSLPALAREALIGKLRREGYLKEEERSEKLLRKALKIYSGKEEVHPEKEGPRENSSRKDHSTVQKRIEAVDFCLTYGRDYTRTAKHFGVSYGQIYDWMKRYQEQGVIGLEFIRGKNAHEETLTQSQREAAEERLRLASFRGNERTKRLCDEVNALEMAHPPLKRICHELSTER